MEKVFHYIRECIKKNIENGNQGFNTEERQGEFPEWWWNDRNSSFPESKLSHLEQMNSRCQKRCFQRKHEPDKSFNMIDYIKRSFTISQKSFSNSSYFSFFIVASFYFFNVMIFIFFYYSWFTVFCQFSTVQHGDSVTHACIHSFFSHYNAPS